MIITSFDWLWDMTSSHSNLVNVQVLFGRVYLIKETSFLMEFLKLPGAADLSGQKYEYKMASLLFLRGVNLTDGFFMGTNVAGAGAFDDVVFKYRLKGEQDFRTCFLQFKHNEKGNKIIALDQLLKPSGDYSMLKYYKSSCEVAKNVESDVYKRTGLFDVNFSNCDFVIYTNAKIEKSLPGGEAVNVDAAFAARTQIFATNNVNSQPSLLNDSKITVIKTECEKLLDGKKNDKELKELQDIVTKHPVEEFLRTLQWFTRQASQDQLDDLIKEEIRMALETAEEDTETIAKLFVEMIQHWWEEKEKSQVLTETAQLWRQLVDSRLSLMNASMRQKRSECSISFSDEEIESFKQSLSGSFVNVTSVTSTLTSVKIAQVLEKYHHTRFILMDQDALLPWRREVLRAWRSAWCDVLAIECSADALPLADELSNALPGKKLILLTRSALPGYDSFQDNFNWGQLEVTSQNQLLEKEVDFQGCDVSLGSLVGEDCNVLTGDVISQVLTPGMKLSIGKKLADKIAHFIPRSLERRDYLKNQVFNMANEIDYFVVSDVTQEHVAELELAYDAKLSKFHQFHQDEVSQNFFWIDGSFTPDDFTIFCEKISNRNVHWLSMDKNNCLYWKQSFNDNSVIKRNIDPTMKRMIRAEDLVERIVLVTADPGMGKSSLVTHLAQEAKEKNRSQWVIRINLNDVTTILEEQTEQYFDSLENVIEFLLSTAVIDDCTFAGEILRSRLMSFGSVSIYLDGFDEICPDYDDKVTNMIKKLMQLKASTIWLTSRIVMQHHLESTLDVTCYSIKPFSRQNQLNFLVQYWNARKFNEINDKMLRQFAARLLTLASVSLKDKERGLTGVPLQCLMLAEAFADDLMNYVKTGDLALPQRLNLLQLYETFVSKKVDIMYKDKHQMDTSKPGYIQVKKRENKHMMKLHTHAAIILLISQNDMKFLKLLNINKIRMTLSSFTESDEKTGMIDGMRDEKPRFIHRTFAEYFLAVWLSENFSSSSDFIEQRLFQPNFATVRQFFDRLLARDCALHNAVVSADRKALRDLLSVEDADVNEVDKGGRTALHIAASYDDNASGSNRESYIDHDSSVNLEADSETVCDDLETDASLVQLLAHRNVNTTVKDTLLQWTPLRYADKTELWTNVEHLLRRGGNTDDLVEIKEYVDLLKSDKNSEKKQIGMSESAMESIAESGCFQILKFAVDECQLDPNVDLLRGTWIVENDLKVTLLHAAARSGNVDSVAFLKERGADLLIRDIHHMMAIHHAAKAGHVDIITLLVNSGVDINVIGDDDMTPLHYAVADCQLNAVKYLIEAKASIENKGIMNRTILYSAARSGHFDIVDCLLEAGAEFDFEFTLGESALINSASEGDDRESLDQIKRLIESGTDPNAIDGWGETALHTSASQGHINVVRYLIEAGADINIQSHSGDTALHKSAISGFLGVTKCLVEAGAYLNVNNMSGETALHKSAVMGFTADTKYLVEAGADVNVKNMSGETALHMAALPGFLGVCKCLVDGGADLSAQDWSGETSLHKSAMSGFLVVCKYLVESGADLDSKNMSGETALHISATKEQVDVVKYFVDSGADVNIQDNLGRTALHISSSQGHFDVAKYLVDAKAHLNINDELGNTALHKSVMRGSADVAKYLLEAGADPSCMNNNNDTPLSQAIEAGNQELITCLSENVTN